MTAAPIKPGVTARGRKPVAQTKAHPLSGNVRRSASLSTSVRRGAIWSMASTILLKLSSIAITAIVARILNQHDFGVFAVANTVFTIVSAFGEFGISSCLARADLRVNELAPTMWSISLGSSAVVAAVLVLFAEPIAASLGSAQGAGPVRVMAIVMVLTGVAAVPTAQCVRDFKQGKIFLANVLSFIPSTVVLLLLARSGSGADAFAWSRVAGQLTSCVVILFSVDRFYRPGLTRGALSVLYQFGVPLAVANFVGYLLQNVDYALIGRLMGPVMLGTYVIAFNAASWSSSLLVGVLAAVAISAFSRVKHDRERLMGAMADGVRAVILIAAPMCTLEMVLARPLVLTLYGSRWVAAVAPLSILTLYGLISIVCLLFSQMLAALGESKFILVIQVVWIIALIPAMAIGVHTHGIEGAAVAHIFIIVPIVLPCYLVALKRATGVRIGMLVKAALPALSAATLAAAIAWFVMSKLHGPFLQLLAGGTAGGLFYLAVTAPQIVVVLGRGKIRNPAVLRAMGAYYRLGRSLGLRVGPPPRHARRRSRPR
jgi:lipopolysaccharide exporter